MGKLVLELLPTRVVGDHQRWCCSLTRSDAVGESSPSELWFEAPIGEGAGIDPQDAEPFVIACVMQAMKEGRDLLIKGQVSKALLQNLEEYVAFWAATAPKVYSSVSLLAEQVVTSSCSTVSDDVFATEDAMAAFSGGLDATFLAWRHHTRQAGWRTRNIRFFVMLSGFDILRREAEHVKQSMAVAAATLATIGAPMKTLRTNLREVLDVPWNHLHGAALVACMHFYKRHARTLLLGSCEKYDDLVIPWGSSPLSDPLLSSSSLRVIHDSAEFTRSEKAAGIVGWPAGHANLRVCWSAEKAGGNCMRCEKCLRTMANFAGQGLPVPQSLGGDDRYLKKHIYKIKLRTYPQAAEWRAIGAFGAGSRPAWQRWIPVMLAFSHLRRAYYVAIRRGERAGVNK